MPTEVEKCFSKLSRAHIPFLRSSICSGTSVQPAVVFLICVHKQVCSKSFFFSKYLHLLVMPIPRQRQRSTLVPLSCVWELWGSPHTSQSSGVSVYVSNLLFYFVSLCVFWLVDSFPSSKPNIAVTLPVFAFLFFFSSLSHSLAHSISLQSIISATLTASHSLV